MRNLRQLHTLVSFLVALTLLSPLYSENYSTVKDLDECFVYAPCCPGFGLNVTVDSESEPIVAVTLSWKGGDEEFTFPRGTNRDATVDQCLLCPVTGIRYEITVTPSGSDWEDADCTNLIMTCSKCNKS